MSSNESDGPPTALGGPRLPDGVDPRRAGSPVADRDDGSDAPERIGRRIREVRRERGLTAKALAQAADVSPGMISQVEAGTTTPSIATLLRVAGALQVGMGELFDQEPMGGRVMRVEDRLLLDYPGSGVRDEIISADPTGNLQVFWCELEPGGGSGEEMLQHGSQAEFALVLEGQAVVSLGPEEVVLGPGETVTFSGRVPHSFRNDHDARTVLLWVTTPASF